MDAIFHEKQEGSLCAQHCLNALLQGPYFSAVDLADIARQLDESEREHMAAAGTDTEGYQQFLKQPSNNYDDSGFFSVQVIAKALHVMDLELMPYNSQNPVSQQARAEPTHMQSYICNFGEHWLTVRKIGNQWFNLNSLLTGPELISDTYLSMFLTQLQQDGYSIFIIVGNLAQCEADELLRLCPAVQPIKPQLITDKTKKAESGEGQDEEVEKALHESKKLVETDDISLQRALQLSMEGYLEESVSRIETACTSCDTDTMNNQTTQQTSSATTVGQTVGGATSQSHDNSLSGSQSVPADTGHALGGASIQSHDQGEASEKPDVDEMRQKRLAFLNRMQNNTDTNSASGTADIANPNNTVVGKTKKDTQESEIQNLERNGVKDESELTEEEMLQKAIAMSMVPDT